MNEWANERTNEQASKHIIDYGEPANYGTTNQPTSQATTSEVRDSHRMDGRMDVRTCIIVNVWKVWRIEESI